MSFKQPGPWLFAIGMGALGVVQMVFQACLPGLKPLPPGWDPAPIMAIGMGLVLALAGAGLLIERTHRLAGIVLAIFWFGWFLAGHVIGLTGDPTNAALLVAASQVLSFAAIAAMLSGRFAHGHRLGRCVLGATLLLFGAVHWLYPDAIAGMIPSWMPMSGAWPWITGAVQVAAGLMILTSFQGALAAFVVGLMWLSWVFLVHIPRLIGAPGDLFEWTFMLTAVALAGAAWSVGERFAPSNRA